MRPKLIALLIIMAVPHFAFGRETQLNSLLRKAIAKGYGGARIDLTGPIRWVRGDIPTEVSEVSFLGDDGRGNAHFIATGSSTDETAEGWLSFSAWTSTKVSLRRIHPGELLSRDMFVVQEVNVAFGQGHEYRGVILSDSVDVAGLETIQTVLEGQFLVSTAVQRVPDVRRGDSVRIHVTSGGLTLSTLGVAGEPSYINRQVRVITGKGKRELLGQLHPGGIVEVNL